MTITNNVTEKFSIVNNSFKKVKKTYSPSPKYRLYQSAEKFVNNYIQNINSD